jgi:hypothetical protein
MLYTARPLWSAYLPSLRNCYLCSTKHHLQAKIKVLQAHIWKRYVGTPYSSKNENRKQGNLLFFSSFWATILSMQFRAVSVSVHMRVMWSVSTHGHKVANDPKVVTFCFHCYSFFFFVCGSRTILASLIRATKNCTFAFDHIEKKFSAFYQIPSFIASIHKNSLVVPIPSHILSCLFKEYFNIIISSTPMS